MKNYNKLKEIIQKANPEIMELKFGRFAEYTKQVKNEPLSFGNTIRDVGIIIWVEAKDDNLSYRKVKIDDTVTTVKDIKILGRPIRLADVLLSMMKKMNGMSAVIVKEELYSLAHEWNCFNDNLNNQNDKTKLFLIDLLV